MGSNDDGPYIHGYESSVDTICRDEPIHPLDMLRKDTVSFVIYEIERFESQCLVLVHA